MLDAEVLAVGASAEVEAGGRRLVLHRSADDRVHAFEAVCTHEGCRVEAEAERFHCPCHGSVFGLDSGEAEAGPAREPLLRFEARVVDDAVEVHI
ncbi:MAG: Rieske (2Fe-2S) protein [Nesterenkonia sp.]|nr:Rieske (2Fe-2S) protein [Nesterenkonia sp.]